MRAAFPVFEALCEPELSLVGWSYWPADSESAEPLSADALYAGRSGVELVVRSTAQPSETGEALARDMLGYALLRSAGVTAVARIEAMRATATVGEIEIQLDGRTVTGVRVHSDGQFAFATENVIVSGAVQHEPVSLASRSRR